MLTTQCPVCFTSFRVRQDQIDVREGKVRCGRCTALFDARAALREKAEHQEPPPEDGRHFPQPLPETESVPDRGVSPSAATANPGGKRPGVDTAIPSTSTRQRVRSVEGSLLPRRRSRVGAKSAILLLFVLLVLQAGYYYRGQLANLAPQLKPALTALCGTLGCELPLPKRTDLISIESSDLRADPGNPAIMVLSATLRNRAAFPQALPALELTLTDMRDQALARRVLTAAQYLGRAANGESSFAANSELPVQVFIEAAKLGAAGYRLYLFYP